MPWEHLGASVCEAVAPGESVPPNVSTNFGAFAHPFEQ